MEQTFDDLWNERQGQTKRTLLGFVLWTFIETFGGIINEQVSVVRHGDVMRNITANPKWAALVGLFFVAPFMILNAIIGEKIEPFISLIRPDTHTSLLEYVLLFIVLFLLPVGAFIAIGPMCLKKAGAKRSFYLVNFTLAAVLLAAFVFISFGLGSDIYRCDVLQIPNCD